MLSATAAALRSAAREDDMVARLGGDEFAIVAHGIDVDGMRHLAERVLGAVRAAGHALADELPGVRVTASVGWALHPHAAATPEELIAVADLSLRGAKGEGKNAAIAAVDWLGEPATG